MKWYRKLYLGSGLEDKKDKLIKKLEGNAGVPGLYVITLASNGKDLFDIFSADMLLQPVLHGHCPTIVGLTKSWEEAVGIAEKIVVATWQQTHSFDVWGYLREAAGTDEDAVCEYPMDKLKRRRKGLFGKKL